jgi:hypothetical protein
MLDSTDNGSFHVRPINIFVQLLVNQAHNRDVITSDQVESMRNLARRLSIIWCADDPLYGL